MTAAQIRRAGARDIEPVARLCRRVRQLCLPYLPDLHTPEEFLWFFEHRVFRDCEVWVAETDSIEGFCAFRQGWVDQLYVEPERHGQGLGAGLLARAMEANETLRLWVFQRNTQAKQFYLARGFRQIKQTDGASNEEQEPDALLAWSRTA